MNRQNDHCDYNIRQWTLDSAVASNKKGCGADKIINDARKFYGYLFPENGKIEEIKNDISPDISR